MRIGAAYKDGHLSKNISLIIHPRSVVITGFVFTLEGYLTNDVEAVWKAVVDTLKENKSGEMIADMVKTNKGGSAGRTVSETVRSTIELVWVDVLTLETSGNFAANVYLDPSTREAKRWKSFVDKLLMRTFSTYKNGVGVVQSPAFRCAGCKGGDHPAHLCSFPRMKGWKGQPAMSEEQEREQERRANEKRDRQMGRSTRGRAWGRGTQARGGRGHWQSGPLRMMNIGGRGRGGPPYFRGGRGGWP